MRDTAHKGWSVEGGIKCHWCSIGNPGLFTALFVVRYCLVLLFVNTNQPNTESNNDNLTPFEINSLSLFQIRTTKQRIMTFR